MDNSAFFVMTTVCMIESSAEVRCRLSDNSILDHEALDIPFCKRGKSDSWIVLYLPLVNVMPSMMIAGQPFEVMKLVLGLDQLIPYYNDVIAGGSGL